MPPKDPKTYIGCIDGPQVPMTDGEHIDVQGSMEGHMVVWGV